MDPVESLLLTPALPADVVQRAEQFSAACNGMTLSQALAGMVLVLSDPKLQPIVRILLSSPLAKMAEAQVTSCGLLQS